MFYTGQSQNPQGVFLFLDSKEKDHKGGFDLFFGSRGKHNHKGGCVLRVFNLATIHVGCVGFAIGSISTPRGCLILFS